MAEEAAAKPLLLLVEDDTELAVAMRATLEGEYDVDWVATADEGYELILSRNYAAILSDHMMPGRMQGLDFLVRSMRKQPKARRILITGYLNPDLIARSITVAGLSACLIKPVSPSRLRQELQQLLSS